MLSNQRLRTLLVKQDPIVKHVNLSRLSEGRLSPLQPASIDLHVGEILVPPEHEKRNKGKKKAVAANPPVETRHDRYTVPSGGSVVLLTKEEINFPANCAGLMFPKSSGLAERGVLVTNFGHVDPGYKGTLRYALINMSSDPLEVRAGDSVACLCVFELSPAANPDFSYGRENDERREVEDETRTREFTKHLSPELLSLGRITDEAKRVAKTIVMREGLLALLISTLSAVVIGVMSAAVAIGFCWLIFIQPRMDSLDEKLTALRLSEAQRTAAPPAIAAPPADAARPAPK